MGTRYLTSDLRFRTNTQRNYPIFHIKFIFVFQFSESLNTQKTFLKIAIVNMKLGIDSFFKFLFTYVNSRGG